MNKQFIKGHVENIEDGILSAIATTDTKDRDGESVNIEGWDLKNFEANPVLLWSHQADQPPIGKVTKLWREGNSLKFNADFIKGDPFAERIKNIVEQGVLNSFSVGFMSKEADMEGNSQKHELFEISLVNVPANPDARMASAYKSLSNEFPKRAKSEEPKPEEKEEEPKKEEKIEEKPEKEEEKKVEVKESFKTRLRLLKEHSQDVVSECDNLLKIAKSPKKEEAKAIKSVKKEPENEETRVLKRIDKEIEIFLSTRKGGEKKQ